MAGGTGLGNGGEGAGREQLGRWRHECRNPAQGVWKRTHWSGRQWLRGFSRKLWGALEFLQRRKNVLISDAPVLQFYLIHLFYSGLKVKCTWIKQLCPPNSAPQISSQEDLDTFHLNSELLRSPSQKMKKLQSWSNYSRGLIRINLVVVCVRGFSVFGTIKISVVHNFLFSLGHIAFLSMCKDVLFLF